VYVIPRLVVTTFYTLEVTSCVRDTEASSDYIFQRRIHTSTTSLNSNSREIK